MRLLKLWWNCEACGGCSVEVPKEMADLVGDPENECPKCVVRRYMAQHGVARRPEVAQTGRMDSS